ncbi:MAG: hypothetical protein MUE44_34965 [Oscillatoriaceae cyanobacterium Prado104]|jgi:hypothetical protein|nr:hypothetical protein [Oscillatoriaceae cyanobacterium Prado104]
MKAKIQNLKFKQHRFAKIGILTGLFFVAIAHIFDIDYFEYFNQFLERYEFLELDEIFMLIFLIAAAEISRKQLFQVNCL